jgi:hypothetical protein
MKPVARSFPAAMVAVALCSSSASAQSAPAGFAEPVRLNAGESLLGAKRLFPSPVFHDIDGDGLQDVVVGDLRGLLTVALRKPGKEQLAFSAETKQLDAEGKEIDFHNW